MFIEAAPLGSPEQPTAEVYNIQQTGEQLV